MSATSSRPWTKPGKLTSKNGAEWANSRTSQWCGCRGLGKCPSWVLMDFGRHLHIVVEDNTPNSWAMFDSDISQPLLNGARGPGGDGW